MATSSSATLAPLARTASEKLRLSRLDLQRLRLAPAPDVASFALDLDGQRVTVRLHRQSLRSPEFRLLVQGAGGLHEVAPPEAATYRGTVDERPGSVVAGTIRNGQLSAAIALADGPLFFVQPASEASSDAEGALHVVYRSDAVIPTDASCATDEEPAIVPPLENSQLGTTQALKVADIAFDADVEFYHLNKSNVDSTVRDIESVMAGVNAVYERDCGITHHIGTIIVRTVDPDPYSTTSPDSLLTQLRNFWNANEGGISRDLVHLMTGKDIDGNVVGYSSVGVVCNLSRAYGFSASRFSTNYDERITLTAHEIGHMWNAVHCNSTTPCNIMCSSIGGCNGFGLPNFEPQGKNAIISFASSRTCLGTQQLAVGDPEAESQVRLEAPWPAPLEVQTSVRFYVAAAGPARLDVHDLSGRFVARLVDGIQVPGWHTVTWNGLDARGRRVEPGVLFLRLETGDTARTQRLIVIR